MLSHTLPFATRHRHAPLARPREGGRIVGFRSVEVLCGSEGCVRHVQVPVAVAVFVADTLLVERDADARDVVCLLIACVTIAPGPFDAAGRHEGMILRRRRHRRVSKITVERGLLMTMVMEEMVLLGLMERHREDRHAIDLIRFDVRCEAIDSLVDRYE